MINLNFSLRYNSVYWILLFIVFPHSVFSQIDTIELTSDTQDDCVITKKLKWYKDASRTLTLDSFKNITQLDSFSVTEDTLIMPLEKRLWFQVYICNPTNDSLHRFLYAREGGWIQVWQDLDDSLSEIAGDFVNYNDCSVPGRYHHLGIQIAPNQCIQLIGNWEHLDKAFQRDFTEPTFFMSLRTKQAMDIFNIIDIRGRSSFPGKMMFFGILFFLVPFMFFYYIQSGDKAYLSYAVYIFSILVYYLFRRNYDFPFPFKYVAQWTLELEPYLALLPVLAYTRFFRTLLFINPNSHTNAYRVSKSIEYLVYSIWILFLLLNIVSTVKIATQVYISYRYIFIIPSAMLLYWMLKQAVTDKLIRYFVIGNLSLLISIMFVFIVDELVLKYGYSRDLMTIFGLQYSQFGIIVESIIFALVLGYRGALIQQEREIFQIRLGIIKDRLSRATLTPHFMNNALTSIKEMFISGKILQGNEYLDKLAILLRKKMQKNRSSKWTLVEELTFIGEYLELESLGFPEEAPLSFHISISENIQAERVYIPIMITQPIVENAVKHGLFESTKKERVLKINVYRSEVFPRIEIHVEDNGIGREVAQYLPRYSWQTGVGIALTRERLQLFHSEAKIIIDDLTDINDLTLGTKVMIYLPQ